MPLPPTPFHGRGSWLGIGIETTWGTAVARTIWLPAINLGIARNVNRAVSPELAATGLSGGYSQFLTGQEDCSGDIEVLAQYGGIGFLMYAVTGKTPAEGGSGPNGYTHTFTMDATQPSLTLEQIRGNTAAADVFEGCKVSSLTLSWSAGEPVRCKASIIAQTGAARGAAGTPTASTQTIVMAYDGGAMSFNGVTYIAQSMELTIDRKLGRIDEVGDVLTAEVAKQALGVRAIAQ